MSCFNNDFSFFDLLKSRQLNCRIVGLIIISIWAFAASAHSSEPRERPNVLFILADDLGWGDISHHGSPAYTPNIDKLAREGVQLTQHYVMSMCTPTRVSLLTGNYASRFGEIALKPSNERVLAPGTETIASLFASFGYDTGLSGKWHLGALPEWGPGEYGFARSYGSLAGGVDPYTHRYKTGPYTESWHRNGKLIEEEGHATDLIGREVVSWIREKNGPWFYYVPFTAVHTPVKVPYEYMARYEDQSFDPNSERDVSYKTYLAYTTQMDHWIGEIRKALEETGQLQNTVIVFSSDNGATPSSIEDVLMYPGHQLPHPRLGDNGRLRGWKRDLYEGGIRVPTFVSWGDRLIPKKLDTPVHIIDWLPTLVHLCGYEVGDRLGRELDGQDISSLIMGQGSEPQPRDFYWKFIDDSWAVRRGDWKLGFQMNFNEQVEELELFNLARDPYENRNLAEKYSDIVEELKTVRANFAKEDNRFQ